MEMPDNVLMMNINLRNTFLDMKSEEKDSSRIKPKYKLLTQKDTLLSDIGVFVFHILTTTEDSYIKEKTIDIFQSDWEYRDGTHLDSPYSKLCSQEVDILNKEKILAKMRDGGNKFSHKGTLSQIKFTEVMDFIKKSFEKTDTRTNFDIRDVIIPILNKKQVAENLLQKFGL